MSAQTPMIAKPRRRSAPFCFLRISSMTAWRSDFTDFLATARITSRSGRGTGAQSLRSRRGKPAIDGRRRVRRGGRRPVRRRSSVPSSSRRTSAPVTRRTAAASSSALAGAPKPTRSASSPSSARTTASRAPNPNRSPASGRTSAAAPGPSSPRGRTWSASPRTTAKGRPPSLPDASSAIPATSSATAGAVTASGLPWASTRPAWSSSTASPAAPIAMSVWPSRQARPAVSVTTTATLRPVRSARAARRRRAEWSGSTGSSTSVPTSTLELSTPAAAMVSPCRVRTIRVGPRLATTRTVSDSTASSRSWPATRRPSDLLTTLLVTTTTSPSSSSTRGRTRSARSSPGRDLGHPVGRRHRDGHRTRATAAAAIAAVASWSVMSSGAAAAASPAPCRRSRSPASALSTSQPSSTPPSERAP